MNQPKTTLVSQFEPNHLSVRSYVYGFVSCLVLTIAAYVIATDNRINRHDAIAGIAILATLQCYVQLRRFLHLGDEFKPRLKLLMFIIMLSFVLIIVGGSLWIMSNLNYRMIESPRLTQKYITSQDGL